MKKAMSIAWHENCLKNQTRYLKEETDSLTVLKKHVETISKRVELYSFQISEAKKLGKESFDSNRFRIKS